MELIKESVKVNKTIHKGSTQTMVEGDIIVPDTKPDILKVLQVDAIACATQKSTENGKASISGKMDLKILYIPDKEGEKIKSIITSFDFSQPIENPKITASSLIAASATAERAEFSLTNSRKLRIKAIAMIDYEITEPQTVEIAVDAEEENDIEIKKENIHLQNSVDFCEHEINLRESIEIPSNQSPIRELLKLDAKITDTEYKTVTGKIVVKGAVYICMLYCDETGNIAFTEEEIPFTDVIDSEDVTEDTVCDIEYVISDISSNVTEDSDGDNRIVDIDIAICAQVKATESSELEMICDCYEPYKKTTLIREDTELEEIVSRPSSQNTIREIIDPQSNAPDVSGVYNAIARPYVSKAELQNNKLLVEGRIETYILYLSDSAENPVYSIKKEIPFSYMLDCDISGSDLIPEIKAEIKHTSYNLNAAGEIELRCILSLNANIIKKRRISIIGEATSEDMQSDDKDGIFIYFAQNGDSLWSVAKHYAVPQEAILKFNNMKETDTLEAGNRLFIPRI